MHVLFANVPICNNEYQKEREWNFQLYTMPVSVLYSTGRQFESNAIHKSILLKKLSCSAAKFVKRQSIWKIIISNSHKQCLGTWFWDADMMVLSLLPLFGLNLNREPYFSHFSQETWIIITYKRNRTKYGHQLARRSKLNKKCILQWYRSCRSFTFSHNARWEPK